MTQADAAGHFGDIDGTTISRDPWRIVLISGMGFFTDAYDLFVIGVAIKLITSEWHLDALIADVFGRGFRSRLAADEGAVAGRGGDDAARVGGDARAAPHDV